MKEKIHTIPVNDGFHSGDECPFCYMRREAERRVIRYVAGPGASYMEPEVREITDRMGFCAHHMKNLYDYGNPLGNALMLQTYYARLLEDFRKERETFIQPEKKNLFGKRKPSAAEPYWQRLAARDGSCYICDRVEQTMQRYYQTFFRMLGDPEFRDRVAGSKGFCMHHFEKLLELAEIYLPNAQADWFYETVFSLMEENLVRVKEDLDWMIALYDYRNIGAPLKNSQDALQRTMQKLKGGYPADRPYKEK